MQSGSEGPPTRRAASPQASSSASVSASNQLGLESQQQLAYKQLLGQQEHQQQQLPKPDGEHASFSFQSGGAHGILGGTPFPSSSGAIHLSQQPRKFNGISNQPGSSQQFDRNQNRVQAASQQAQLPVHHAYLQYAMQAVQQKSQANLTMHQQAKLNSFSLMGRDQDMHANNLKMQELMSQQTANHSLPPAFRGTNENFAQAEKQVEQVNASSEKKSDRRPPAVTPQLTPTNMARPMQAMATQVSMQNHANNPSAIAQMQAMQSFAKEHNIDLSIPANVNMISQILPYWQFNKMAAIQKQNETNSNILQRLPTSKQIISPAQAGNESSAHGSPSSDCSGQPGLSKGQLVFSTGATPGSGDATSAMPSTLQMQQHVAPLGRINQNERVGRPLMKNDNGRHMRHLMQPLDITNQSMEHLKPSNVSTGNNIPLLTPLQQMNQSPSQPAIPVCDVVDNPDTMQGGSVQSAHQQFGFTKQQLFVLKAQILAFRRLNRGERILPPEVLQAIGGGPVDPKPEQSAPQSEVVSQDWSDVRNTEEVTRHVDNGTQINHHAVDQHATSSSSHTLRKEESGGAENRTATINALHGIEGSTNDCIRMKSNGNSERSNSDVKSEHAVEKENHDIATKGESSIDKGKTLPVDGTTQDNGQGQGNRTANSSITQPPKDSVTRKYHGPLFDFLSFTRKHDLLGSTTPNYPNSFRVANDVTELLLEEGKVIATKRRNDNLMKINKLLAVNLERKRIRPDLVVRLQIEEKKLRLLDLQARLREEVDQQQQEIMSMPDRPYRKFVRQCERQRSELVRQVQQLQKSSREKQLKSLFQWRKKLLEAHWTIRDARTSRNKGVAKYHERMLREFSRRKDEDRTKRMEALKNNDVDRYRAMLLEQQTNMPGDAAQRYEVLSSFLSHTEEYLDKLGGKITAAKGHQEAEDAANAAAAAARAQGLSEEEVRAAAARAGEEVMIRNKFSEMNAPKDSSSVNQYYTSAHAVTEKVARQPSLLRAGTLRDYQLVGLQWMLSLYNNKLNGILADEMGLGKTVQVMALIAYLMEFKGNYGPHLIIVPNAVLVNWKSELMNWLPSASCIFYVGGKDHRSKLFSQEVRAVKFNILVTTYEFIMYDRSKLSKIDWRYIIIDEAQRMKDRESVLARDLDRYRCQRRLLLTGTPLQNDLKELWSLLNLLLPEVFDNRKSFHDWFSKPFQKDAPSHIVEDDWLETEKKVIVIHRLHQILEPFMLRRRVEDVEGSLPRKVSIVLRCRMSAIQGAIYDWIKSTGTIRVDPEDEMQRLQKNPLYQIKSFKNLNNKCMELRKVCNHPLLNYPYYNDYSKEFVVRSCGKLWVLDRILIKLQRAGHRVLLFSTMTKLLDILEEYLQWRRLIYRRIDGTTSLEDRESAIVDFNSPDSNCFIFLLSIRAAGRGLNLQTADTVVIYDPDPNPQNEEQAVARAYRIGQKREVKVIYMEAVVDNISSYQKEDEFRDGGVIDSEDDLAGKDRYMGSIESLIRNNIQQYKIEMADEVINAGRFDQRTTQEERRMTLETLLHDEERYQETVHDVPSMQEVNRMIARSEDEVEMFDQMDEDLDWTMDMVKHNEIPKWLRASSKDVDAAVAILSKKPSKNILPMNYELEENQTLNASSPGKSERRRGRPRVSSANKRPIYRELDDSDIDDLYADSEERNVSEDEGEMGESEEELNGVGNAIASNRDQVKEEELVCDEGGFEIAPRIGSSGNNVFEEAGYSGSSSGSRRLQQPETPSMSSRKFGSLSALDAKPGSSKRIDELEEGEIAASGDSHLDTRQSDIWPNGNEEGEDEQALQPKIKRKRSIRLRPGHSTERVEKRAPRDELFFQHGPRSPLKLEQDHGLQFRTDQNESPGEGVSRKHEKSSSNSKQRHNISSRKISPRVTPKSGRLSNVSGSADDGNDHSRESWSSKGLSSSGPSSVARRMSDSTQRKCKNVISKLQRRIDKEGNQLFPLLSDLWINENSGFPTPGSTRNAVLDLHTIEHRIDNLEYDGVPAFVSDVQLILKNVIQLYDYSHEVKYEATKLRDVFFDIMKIAFPDSDFREARNSMKFSSLSSAASVPSQKGNQSKLHVPSIKTDVESVPSKVVLHKAICADDNAKMKAHAAKPQDSRLHGTSGREQMADCSQLLAHHPGDLVVCKKKRKDREKSAIKQTLNPASPSAGRLAPISPPTLNQNAKGPSFQRSPHLTQQASSRPLGWGLLEMEQPDGSGGSPNLMDVQWAKPVKRTRTDAGKRRPSNL